MSHLSTDNPPPNRPKQNANTNEVQVSNQTSGHFLGTVPRNWMLHQGNNSTQSVNTNTAPQRSHALPNASSKNATTQRTVPEGSPNLQTQSISDGVHPILNRQTAPRPQSGGHFNETSVQASNTNSDASNSNSSIVHSLRRQFVSIPTSNASPVNYGFAFPGGLSPLQAHLATGSSVGHSMDLSSMSIPQPTTLSPQLTQASRPSISLNLPVTGSSAIPTSRPRGRPLGPRKPQPPKPTSPATVGVPVRQIPQPQPTGSFTPLRASNLSQPQVLQKLIEMKDRLTKDKSLNNADVIRFAWLHDACQSGDEFYVLLHQLTCVWTHYTGAFTNSLGLSTEHVRGLGVLSHILKDNRNVSGKALAFLANFPRNIQNLSSDRSPNFARWMNGARVFLHTLTSQWPAMSSQVAAHTCPPSARELAEMFNLDSPVLARAIYTSFFYDLFPGCTQAFARASFDLFRTSQENLAYRMRSGIINTSQDVDGRQESVAFRRKFYELVRTLYMTNSAGSLPDIDRSLNANTRDDIRTPLRPPSNPVMANAAANSSHPLFARSGTSSASTNPGVTAARLIPRAGQLLPIIVNPTPNRNALHQAHLSDPCMRFDHPPESSQQSCRMFSFLERLVGDLQLITTATVFQVWSISVPAGMFERRAKDLPIQMDDAFAKKTRLTHSTSIMFNLRCVQLKPGVNVLSEPEYSAEPTSWPTNIFISINDTHLEFRRKIHYGRDLPVDVTDFVRQGSNDIQLSYHPTQLEMQKEKQFAIGLEAVVMLNHDAVCRMPILLDAASSRTKIAEQVQRSNIEDDIVMADTDISIDIIDPFTARIFEQPVRGISCRHRECFDLEAFLQSRNCRNKDNFVHADEWKCPICGKDARPDNLVIDGFLLQVREKLFADGLTDTKAILFKEDGTWVPKVETVSSSNTNRNQNSAEPQHLNASDLAKDAKADGLVSTSDRHSTVTATEAQIIVLDDDDENE